MTIKVINNLFTDEELKVFAPLIDHSRIPVDEDGNYVKIQYNGVGVDNQLGRIHFKGLPIDYQLSSGLRDKLSSIVSEMSSDKLSLMSVSAVEYNGKYGTPNLPIHFDHDNSELIINYQIQSNTKWDLGVDLKVYSLEDNTAIIFNPNKYTHWRPHKTFKEGEFVRMIFMRFACEDKMNDYSHLDYTIGHPIFKEIEEFRESLRET